MKQREVLTLIEPHGRLFEIDPYFLLALCEQESGYDESEVRLENGFYRRYARPMSFPTSTEVLFSASYGLTQIMGEVLYELGYFKQAQGSIAGLIDRYMARPELHIEYACKMLRKIKETRPHVRQILLRYNGGGNPRYPEEVLNRYARICREYDVPCDESPV